ncbi:sodium-dependent transporter [Campylobacter novaezeelandiae]|uniref:sodium-dependent transporter n=1 Tax=Campylobacter novaezeelandiae TaxID=2267891 RepID=UPI001036F451|nr:sodium-dependent transporter [Campylobacter novaezeelandiae]MBK1964233.1 sodium-dependent transporter [Campylobacter novaezeelandiae]MBK1993108.1 sodium-dependent transporter [Campylobacter novaezeelandiae]QWU79606.1 sodium-dependent transporter, SNF family [Campylobacter novaezeelandiae]TBR79719.1 sodium-dependent transporter [Campylobacter novaezeelandiae]
MSSKFSKIGFILAVAGSAVGLGNAWKFPTLVGQNGGSAFVLLYLILTLGVGFVIFLAELALGKLSEKDPVNAYRTLAPKHKKAWSFAGFTMIANILIASFYSVIIGWILKYVFLSITFELPFDINSAKDQFNELLHKDFLSQLICFTLVFFVIFYIVSKGVKNGIEKLNIWMMPTLFILLIMMLVYTMSKDGFYMAAEFLFVPDFSKISVSAVLEALGMAFFSLSLGVGTIITYSASLPDKTNFITSTLNIIFINILVGILMGLIVFTFIFEFNADPAASGPGLIFISLSTLFSKLGIIGSIFAVAFFISLIFAGITSAISMIEPFAFYLINTYEMSRKKALIIIGFIVYILGIFCILSYLSFTHGYFSFFGMSFFDILDSLSSKIIMPLGGILVAIFVGFIMKKEGLKILFKPYMRGIYFELWYVFLRFISPLAVIIIMISTFIR